MGKTVSSFLNLSSLHTCYHILEYSLLTVYSRVSYLSGNEVKGIPIYFSHYYITILVPHLFL